MFYSTVFLFYCWSIKTKLKHQRIFVCKKERVNDLQRKYLNCNSGSNFCKHRCLYYVSTNQIFFTAKFDQRVQFTNISTFGMKQKFYVQLKVKAFVHLKTIYVFNLKHLFIVSLQLLNKILLILQTLSYKKLFLYHKNKTKTFLRFETQKRCFYNQ